jgi:hypothetical protein
MASLKQLLCGCCDGSSGGMDEKLIESQKVVFDRDFVGGDVRLAADGRTVSGVGVALSACQLLQDKAYFELKALAIGPCRIGIATHRCKLNGHLGDDAFSWGFDVSSKTWMHKGTVLEKSYLFQVDSEALDHSGSTDIPSLAPPDSVVIKEGDVIGVTVAQTDCLHVAILVNGVELVEHEIYGALGDLYAGISVAAPATFRANFGVEDMEQPVPYGFMEMLYSTSVMF